MWVVGCGLWMNKSLSEPRKLGVVYGIKCVRILFHLSSHERPKLHILIPFKHGRQFHNVCCSKTLSKIVQKCMYILFTSQ